MTNIPKPTIQPLSIGNVVTAAIILYRSHFKSYFGLAFQGVLWSIIPIYGWAMSLMISGMISRLAYRELINEPETITEARTTLMKRLWDFLLSAFIIGLIMGAAIFGFYFAAIIVVVLPFAIISPAARRDPALALIGGLIAILLFLVLVIVFIAGVTWLYSRFMIAEIPIAIEDLEAGKAISRSWELTTGFVSRLQGVLVVTFSVGFPLIIATQILAFILQDATQRVFAGNPGLVLVASFLVGYAIGLPINAIILPIWQIVKAVIYYDLRSRREGLGINLNPTRSVTDKLF